MQMYELVLNGERLSRRAFALSVLVLFVLIICGTAAGADKVNASDILQRIASGQQVRCDGVVIAGDLNLSRLNLPSDDYGRRIVASRISIINCALEGNANFAGIMFSSPVDFSGTTFRENASFLGSQFASTASFNRTRFLAPADFSYSAFKDLLDFEGSILFKSAEFNVSEFNIYSDFSGVSFRGPAIFKDAVFKGYTYLDQALFNGSVSFYRAEFYQEAHFDDAKFLGYADFNESRFKDYTYFSGAKFTGPLFLNKTKMSDWMIDWSSIKGHLVYNEAAYLALMQRFWASGNFDAYDDCYYQYRWQKQSLEPMGTSKAYDALAWATCGYGVRPQHTFAFGFALMIIFGLIFWRADLARKLPVSSSVSQSENQKKKSWLSGLEESMYFSIMMFLTRPPYGLHPVGRWRYLIISEYILGWLLMALFLVTLGKLMIR